MGSLTDQGDREHSVCQLSGPTSNWPEPKHLAQKAGKSRRARCQRCRLPRPQSHLPQRRGRPHTRAPAGPEVIPFLVRKLSAPFSESYVVHLERRGGGRARGAGAGPPSDPVGTRRGPGTDAVRSGGAGGWAGGGGDPAPSGGARTWSCGAGGAAPGGRGEGSAAVGRLLPALSHSAPEV